LHVGSPPQNYFESCFNSQRRIQKLALKANDQNLIGNFSKCAKSVHFRLRMQFLELKSALDLQ